jgi:hypothetical protein
MDSNTMNAPQGYARERRDDRVTRPAAPQPQPTRPIGMTGTPAAPEEMVQTTQVLAPQDRVRWGPIWAGLLTALTTFLLLELLAYGLGLLTSNDNGAVSASGAAPWVSGALGLIAFFLGGYIAERAAVARGGSAGLLNGFLVWALGTGLILLLSVVGLGSLFGALGNVIGQFLAAGHSVSGSSPNVNPGQVAQVTQSAALGAFFSLLLSAAAAALGGLLGSGGRALGRLLTQGHSA